MPSMSDSPMKRYVFVMARLSGCCVITALGVTHMMRLYFPLQEDFVQEVSARRSLEASAGPAASSSGQ